MPKRSNVNVKGKQISVGNDVVGGDKITTTNHITNFEASAPLALSLHQLPPPPSDFTGREAELKELLAHVETGAVISGLRGQGGIGKTALALKLAEHLTPRYPDAQFYLDLKGASDKPLTPAEALAHVIRAYYPTNKLPESETDLRALYLSVLHEKRALLLMDNAKDAAQVTPLIPPATCYLLITSRQHFHLPGLFAKDLEQMPPEDARELLIRIAPRLTPSRPPPSEKPPMGEGRMVADEIAKLCGYLPLALRLTASALAERADLSPADLIRKLNDAQTRLKLTGIEASLQLSYDLLSPELQKLWRALAVFPDTFDRAAATAVWELEEDNAHDVLGELVKYSLLDFAPTPPLPRSEKQRTGEGVFPPSPVGEPRAERSEAEGSDGGRAGDGGRYRLHDLARLYADTHQPEPERHDTQKRHAVYYEIILRIANELYKQGDESIKHGLTLFDLEWINIQTGQAWAKISISKDKAAANLCSRYPDAGVYLLLLRQHPRDHIHWLEDALIVAQRLKDRAAEATHLGNLGLAYADLGEARKAIKFYEQSLTITRQSGDRRSEGSALGNLGLAHADLGETHKAIKFYEQHLIIAREIGDRRGEGNALGNLGNAYHSLGENPKALEYQEQRLIIAREIGDRRGEGNALGSLGLAYANLGKIHKAIKFFEQDLAIAREIGYRRGEGQTLTNLGNSYYLLGETRKAIEFYEQALIITHETGNQRGEAANLWGISLALDKLGERAKAITHAEAALKIYEQIEGPNAEKVRRQLEAWRADGASNG